ncbi:YfhO family protein, partial [Eubacteriales bacterium OttesenSCG-928-G02]|nr:YfhO family protein [Eubacteriales bacterium OttesenSCG-928-G02]
MGFIKDLYIDDHEKELKSPYFFYKRSFVTALILATLIIIPFVVVEFFNTGSFVFLYYGDYNVQQIPFYEHCISMVHQGNFGWDWLTDLGSNFIGSYSYYLLGSPFFWIMCLFPSSWAPFLMAPIYVLKFACAALTSYAFLQRFVKQKNYAVLGSLLYAFCGFQVYNVFFNQFHEVVVMFPLLLLGIEESIQNNRKGLFAIAVALNAMCNYFMFAGQVVFCIIYFLFRASHNSFRITLKKFIILAFEAVIGAMLSMVLFLPAALAVMGNPRVDGSLSGLKMFIYYKNFGERDIYDERYGHIIQSLFFPPDIPSRVNFFYGHDTRWASNAAWVPLFGMSGLFAYIKSRKTSRYGILAVFLIICALVPVLNSMFFLLNASYYARWVYMLVMVLIITTIIALDDKKISFTSGIVFNSVVCVIITTIVGLVWIKDGTVYKLGKEPFAARLWVSVAIALGSMIILFFIIKRYRNTRYFQSVLMVATCVVIVAYSVFHIFSGKNHSSSVTQIVDNAINGEVVIDDDDFYRIDFFRYKDIYESVYDNLGISWSIPSVECFHTVVPPSIMEFYDSSKGVGPGRGVGSRADYRYYGLRPFLSVKYSFIKEGSKNKHFTVAKDSKDKGIGHNYEYFDTQNGYAIFKNNYYLSMGFAYDEFMTVSEYNKIPVSDRHILLCKYLIVPDDERDYYLQFMKEVVDENSSRINSEGATPRVKTTLGEFEKSLEERAEST